MRTSIHRHLLISCCALLSAFYFDKALADSNAGLQEQFKELQTKVKKFKREKNLGKARAAYPEMWSVYAKMYDDKQIGKKDKLNAGLAVVQTFIAEGECRKALDLCDKLFAIPGLSAGDKVKIQCAVGNIAKSAGQYRNAEKEYRKALDISGSDNSDKLYACEKMAMLFWRDDRNPDKLKNVVQKMLELDKKSRSLPRWLKILAMFRFPDTSYTSPENVEFAWENLLKQDKITVKDKALAYPGLIEAKLRLRKIKEAREMAESAKADKDVPTETRLMAAFVLLGLKAVDQKKTVAPDALKQVEEALKADKLEQYNALNEAAAALRCLNEGTVARQFLKIAEKLVAKPEKTYLCRYIKEAPLGASGWLSSSLLDNPEYRETRFKDYKQKDADVLITDVNAERATSAKAKNKAYYFKNTAFYMVYDQNGWHIFVLCREPKIRQMLLDGISPGALEMYFAPGAENTYYQWIISLNDGKLASYDWNSPNRFFRPAGDFIKTETIISGDKIGTYVFFPWEMLYDKLPFGSGKDWIYELIRWSPAGGISWSGGKVHNTGKWGHIKWEPPTEKELIQIKKNLLRKAWGKYKQTRKALVDDYWAKRDFGDPGFFKNALEPEVKRLNKLGEAMAAPDKLSDADVDLLYRDAISDWMEFKYNVAELRRDYLTKRLTASSRENK